MSDEQGCDFKFPEAIISRIIKDALPESANVGKATRKAISHAAAVFVVYSTTNAQRLATKAHRKMVSGPDVIKAVEDMDLADLVPGLEDTLTRLRNEHGLKDRKVSRADPEMAREELPVAESLEQENSVLNENRS